MDLWHHSTVRRHPFRSSGTLGPVFNWIAASNQSKLQTQTVPNLQSSMYFKTPMPLCQLL